MQSLAKALASFEGRRPRGSTDAYAAAGSATKRARMERRMIVVLVVNLVHDAISPFGRRAVLIGIWQNHIHSTANFCDMRKPNLSYPYVCLFQLQLVEAISGVNFDVCVVVDMEWMQTDRIGPLSPSQRV